VSQTGEEPRRIRVMMVGPFPRSPAMIDGGVASAVTYLSQALAKRTDIDLVGVRIAKDQNDACEVRKYDWPMADLQLGRLGLSTLYRRQQRQLGELIAHFRPDIVHGQESDIAGFLAVRSGLPAVVTVHGLLGECAKFQTDRVRRVRAILAAKLTERSTIRASENLIVISPYVTRYYEKDIRGQTHHIPNAVSSSFFAVTRKPEPGRFLYAGRIANGKGLLDLLQSVALCGDQVEKLVLAGATPDPAYELTVRQEVERLELGPRVIFAGLLDEKALLDEISRASALVLPSYQETAPMVVQEAMAAGLAVIATTVGGICDQVENGVTGLLFKPGDVSALAGLLARLCDDPTLCQRLGAAAKSVAERRYRADAVASATAAVYRSMRTG